MDSDQSIVYARAIYWFSALLLFEFILSRRYQIENKNIRSKKTGKFSNTANYLISFLVVGLILFLFDAIFSEPLITLMSTLGNSLIPILFSIICFDIVYVVKYVIGRDLTSKYPRAMLIFGIGGIIAAIIVGFFAN